MSLLQQFRQLFTKSASTVPDKSFGLLKQLEISKLLAKRQWAQFEATAAQLPPNDLTRLVDGLCLTTEYTKELANYQQLGQPELSRLLAGVHATFIAWQIRGGAYAKYVGTQQMEGFTMHLQQAYDHLNHPFRTPTYQAEAAARLVRVTMGLSEPKLAHTAFAHCVQLVPAHLQGHLFYFNVLTRKWFGDEEKLEHFVEVDSAPTLRPLLQAMYLVEQQVADEDSSEIVKQQLRNEQAPRLKKLFQESRPLTDHSLYAVYFNNYLASLHHTAGQQQARDTFLRVLGTHITPYPWAYHGLGALAVQKLVGGSLS